MKSPAEYLAHAHHPGPTPPPGYLPQAQAERAVEAALADAEKYRDLLLKALRRPTALVAALTQFTNQP